jgi:hypothetical protein
MLSPGWIVIGHAGSDTCGAFQVTASRKAAQSRSGVSPVAWFCHSASAAPIRVSESPGNVV